MLQGDSAGLVEARLDVLLAVWNRLVLFNITLEEIRAQGEFRTQVNSKTQEEMPDLSRGC